MSMKSRKQREFERRGEEILAAALSLFATDAWEEVTVEQIANKAEVGKGTVYKHFTSKYEIYAHLVIGFQHQTIDSVRQIDTNLPVLEQFSLRLQAIWDTHLSSRELHRVFLYCSRPEFRSKLCSETISTLDNIEKQLGEMSYQLVTDGIAQGIFPDRPYELLMFGVRASLWGAIELIWSGHLGDIDQKAYLQELDRFIIAGLTGPDLLNK